VITVRDMETIYQVPLLLKEQGLLELLRQGLILDKLALPPSMVQKGASLWELWKKTVIPKECLEPVNIALIGKYVEHHDAYLSVTKSLEHSAMRCHKALRIQWIDAEYLEDSIQKSDPTKYHKAWHEVCTASGILIPGGFGIRGSQGMIRAVSWARTKRIPMLAVCLGLQICVIEVARNLCGYENATSEEFEGDSEHRVVIFMPEGSRTEKGGTMRLVRNP